MAAGKNEGGKISEAGPLVFVITRADEMGGAQVYLLELAASFKENGEEVIVLAGGEGILFEHLKARGIACRSVKNLVHPVKVFKDAAAFFEIRAILKACGPSLVSTHSNKAGLLGRLAAKSLGLPAVHTSHGFLFGGREKSPAGYFYRVMEKLGSAAASKVIAVAESEAALAGKFKVIPEEKLAVIHNGLPDLEQTLIADPLAEPPQLVMVARFAVPKDHRTLLTALGDLKEYPWQLALVGEGPGLQEAKKLARQLEINERVAFLGTREDVPNILAEAQVFVLSTLREGFPLSVLEAMRAGLPVVASNVGGVPEAVIDARTGLLFAPGDHLGLRDQLKFLLENPEKRKEMGQAGRKLFMEQFTLEKMSTKTAALYRSLAKSAGEGEKA